MSTSARFALIAAITLRHAAPKVAGIMLPSRHDVRDATFLATHATHAQDSGDLPMSPTEEDDGKPLPSQLPFESAQHANEADGHLTASEVKALRREGIEYRPFVVKSAPVATDPLDETL